MPSTNYPFTTPANYAFANTELVAGKGQLSLINATGEVFNEDFATDAGFTFDSALAEFSGGLVRQKDRTPTDSTLHSEYSSSVDANWADGATAVTANVGGNTVAGGRLNLKGKSGSTYIEYAGLDNADSAQVGCARFNFIPDYTGAPATHQNMIDIGKNGVLTNNVRMIHTVGDDVNLFVYSSAGAALIVAPIILSWSPTAGVSYEFEINWDITTGATRVFLDGIQQGATLTATGTRTNDVTHLRIGENYNTSAPSPDFEMDNLIIFSTVQHTVNYTPAIVIPATRFGESIVELPAFTYSGLGQLQALESLPTTQVGAAKYHIDVAGQDTYWDGAAWVNSDGTYLQSSSQTDFSTNAPSLVVLGETTLIMKAVFSDSQTLQSVDDLSLNHTGEKFNTTGTIVTNSSFMTGEITDFIATLTEPGADLVKFAFEVDSVNKYWDGGAWVVSNLTEAQTNTLAEVQTNVGTLLTLNSTVKVVTFLKSAAPTATTPDIDDITVTHEFGATSLTAPLLCSTFGFILDAFNVPVVGATVEFSLATSSKEYAEAADHIINEATTATEITDGAGYFTRDLIRTSEFEGEGRYIIKITDANGKKIQTVDGDNIVFTVPDQASANITSLITQV